MADKIIADLPLIAAVTDSVNVPIDDGIVTYRSTALQWLAYILAEESIDLSMLDTSIFNGLSAVTPADDDYLTIVDTSDSNLTKKVLISNFTRSTYRSVTTTDSVAALDDTMKLSGASFTSTLPTAIGIEGKKYKFIHAGTSLTQLYTLATTSAQTIGGIASGSFILSTAGEMVEVESDGANWLVTSRHAKTAPAAYTPTYTGFGTVTNIDMQWWRDGKFLHVRGYAQGGTPTGTEARVSLPGSVVTASQTATLKIAGHYLNGGTSTDGHGGVVFSESSKAYMTFSRFDVYGSSSMNPYSKGDANLVIAANNGLPIDASFEIAAWQP